MIGGGANGMLAPPSQIIGGGGTSPPGYPSSYAYDRYGSPAGICRKNDVV